MAQIDDGPGAAPYAGGGSGGAGDVELTFSDVEKIGQDTAALSGEAQAAKASVADARGAAAAFGSYGPAQAVFAHHQAVVNVFEDTLAAITTDLDNFGNAIVQAVHAHEQTDSDAAASLASVGSRLTPDALKDRYDEARNQQGQKLDNVGLVGADDIVADNPGLKDAVDAVNGSGGDNDTTDSTPVGPAESSSGYIDTGADL
jgi:hypothetical protein